jgi:ABC-type branched-subunit amino acid transport system permease subunit
VNILAYIFDMFTYVGVFGLLAISLNLEAGYTRLMNFGKVAFFAVGAYVSALLTVSGLPFVVGLGAAVAFAGLFGLLIAIPTLKLREDYLAITTIAAAEIVRLILLNEKAPLGPTGVRGIPKPLFWSGGLGYPLFYLVLVWAVVLVCFLIAQRVVRSPFGRVLKAIREDEVATEALGKDVFRFKTKSLVLGSCMAGAAGSLFAHYIAYISTDMFMPLLTFSVWTMMIIGGTANNYGVLLGAFLIQLFERSTRFLKDFIDIPAGSQVNLRWIVIGLLIILFLLYRPGGVLEERKTLEAAP